MIDETKETLNIKLINKFNKRIIDNDTLQELDERTLRLMLQLFTFDDPNSFASAIKFFDSYLSIYNIPMSISSELQPIIVGIILVKDISLQIVEPCLRIISNISRHFQDDYDFITFIDSIWHFIPSPYAFDTISNFLVFDSVLQIILSDKYMRHLIELFQLPETQSFVLNIFISISAHFDVSHNLIPLFRSIIQFHKAAAAPLKTQCFELFENLINNREWLSVFLNCEDLPSIFAIDASNKGNVLAALRFLSRLSLLSGAAFDVIQASRTFDLILHAIGSNSELIRTEVMNVLEEAMESDPKTIDFIDEYEIGKSVVEWCKEGKFSFCRRCMCFLFKVCKNGTAKTIICLISCGFMDILIPIADSFDPECVLSILLIFVEFSINSGNNRYLDDLSMNTDLYQFLESLLEGSQNTEIENISNLLISKIFPTS